MGWLIELLPLSYSDSVVLIGAVILGATAGMLGTFAVLPGRSLVGDALSHATLPGVAFAFILTGSKDASMLLIGAAALAGLGALLMVAIERAGRIPADAAIGVVLAGFFSLGVVLLTFIASGDDSSQAGLESYLFGQAAGLLEGDLVVMAALGLVATAIVVIGFRPLKVTMFDPSFAGSAGLPVRLIEFGTVALLVVAIIVGIRTVGAILMVALLIVPAVAARQLADRLSLVLGLAAAIGATVGASGALASTAWEVPTGPVIVIVGFLVVMASILLAPGRGVLWKARKLRADRRQRLTEGALLDIETAIHVGPPPTEEELRLISGWSARNLRVALGELRRRGMLAREGDRLHLTEKGAAAAHALIERRELWTAWLEHGWRLDLPDAREPDPSDLTASLGPELTARLRDLEGEGREERSVAS